MSFHVSFQALADRFSVDVRMFDQIDRSRLKELVRDKDPIQALHELCMRRGLKTEEQSFLPSEDKAFRVVLKIGDRSIEGESSASKRSAKRVAAVRAMKEIFGIDILDGANAPSQASATAATGSAKETIGEAPSPDQVLQRIAAVAGVTLVYENVSIMPKFGVKLVFGQGESVGFGHTRDEAKTKAAVGILHQMGIGQYFGHVAPEEEAGAEPEALQEDEEPLDRDYSSAPEDWGWQQGGGWIENYASDDYWQSGMYEGEPHAYGYQQPQPFRSANRGRSMRADGGYYFGNDLRHHFARPF